MARLPSESVQSHKKVDFPDMENTPKKTKQTPKYCKDIVQAIYSQYVNNKTAVSYGMTEWFDILRLYAKGKQPESMYDPNSADTAG